MSDIKSELDKLDINPERKERILEIEKNGNEERAKELMKHERALDKMKKGEDYDISDLSPNGNKIWND